MRTYSVDNIPCALVRPAPSVSGVALRDLSSAPSGTEKSRAAIGGDAYQIEPRITHVDRAIIRGYFRQHSLVPRLRPANMESLFTGIRKYLLPDELECRLSGPFPGHVRILVGSDVLLVEIAMREIVDVMYNAGASGESEAHVERRNRALTSHGRLLARRSHDTSKASPNQARNNPRPNLQRSRPEAENRSIAW